MITTGSKVRVVAISKEDSYYEDRHEFLGKKGEITFPHPCDKHLGGGWFSCWISFLGGGGACFYKVKLAKA